MSHLQPGISGGHLPIHAFYIPPQAAHVALATSSVAHKSTMEAKQKLVFATPTATRPFRVIQTAAAILPTHVQHSRGYSSLVPASSSMPSQTVITMLPPSINPPPYDSSFDNEKSASTSNNGNNVPWLAPLLGVFGAMGVIIIAIIYLVRRRRYKLSSSSVVPNNDHHHPRYPKPTITSNKHSSWASLSTINTSVGAHAAAVTTMSGEDKTPLHMLQSPPAYSIMTTTKTPVQQKRLTADTLVDEPSLSMLKSQYSPQLAFSPSLVAGEFQQQLDHPPLPNTATLSPSNTLIDNAGVLSNDKNQNYYSHDAQQQRIKIEMYDPQVNLHNAGMMDGEDEDEDGFGTPYNKNYPNHQEEKVNAAASEGDKHITAADATATKEHQVINMSTINKQ